MSTAPTTALVGTASDRLGAQWASALVAAGLAPVAVWSPDGEVDVSSASELAARLGLDLHSGPLPRVAGLVVTARGAARVAALAAAAEDDVPVLLDAPFSCTTAQLESTAASVVPGQPFPHHPGFARVVAAVRAAEIGLLRAVAIDLVMTAGSSVDDRAAVPVEVLRDLGGQGVTLARALTGPAIVRLQSHATPSGSWSLLGRTDREVVVSLHASVVAAADERPLLATVRAVGTHGSVTVDLARPALQVRTAAGEASVPYGEGAVAAMLRHAAAVFRGDERADPSLELLAVARALDAIESSAASAEAIETTW